MADQVIIEFVGDTSKLEEAYGKVSEQITDSANLNKDSLASFQKANVDAAASVTPVTDGVKHLNDQLRNLTSIIAGGVVKGLVNDLNAVTAAQAKAAAGTKALSAQLSEAGKTGAQAFATQRKEIEQLNAAITDLQVHINSVSAESKTLSGLAGIGHGAAIAFEGASGALALFGAKNEAIEKSVLKLQTAMTVLNSMMEMQKALTIESAAAQLAQNIQLEAGILAEQLQTAVLSENVIVSKAATAAQWLLNLAMEANPIGLVVAAIGGLVSALMVFSRESETAAEKHKKFMEGLKDEVDYLDRTTELMKLKAEQQIRNSENYIAVRRAEGASSVELRDREAALDAQRVKSATDISILFAQRIAKFKEHATEYLQTQQSLNMKLRDMQEAQASGGAYQKKDGSYIDGKELQSEIEKTQQAYNQLTSEINQVTKVINDYNDAVNTEQINAAKRQKETAEEGKRNAKADLQARIVEAKAGSKAELDLKLQAIKDETEQELQNIDLGEGEKRLLKAQANQKASEVRQAYNVKVLEEAKAAFDANNLLVKQGTQEALDIKLADLQKQAVIDKAKVQAGAFAAQEISNIDKKLIADTAAAKKEFSDKQRADDLAAATITAQATLQLTQKNSQMELTAKKAVLQAEHDAQVNNINTTINNEKLKSAEVLKANADLKKQLEEADTDFLKNQVAANQDHSSKLTSLAKAQNEVVQNDPKASAQDKIDANQKVLQAEHDGLVQQLADATAMYYQEQKLAQGNDQLLEKIGQNYELNAKLITTNITKNKQDQDQLVVKSAEDAAKKRIDTEKQIATASINFAKQASDQIFQTINQNRNNRYNAEISTLQKQAAFELNNNNLTQAQKLAIQRKFDKEQAAVKLQQWKADQKSKEEQAIINGALAITNAFATAPWPLSIITAATAAATTAVQVATIAAQKPPQFAKGTPKGTPVTPAGTKLVGEHGPELIYTPGGERIITAPDTAAILAKYDVPALPNVSPAIAMRANLNHTHPLINEDTLAKKIALEISKQTKPHLTFDKNGFTAHLINRGSKTTILNNKYKL